jgi:putative membrane protein
MARRRLHPLTPLLRGARLVWVVLAVLAQQGLQHRPSAVQAVVGLAVVAVVAVVLSWISWRTTSYVIVDGVLVVDSGVFQKRSRRVPLARLQSIDVVRPLLARALGLAELRIEVAGGGKTEADLAFLTEEAALALRAQLLGLADAQPDPAVTPDEQLLVRVPTRVLIESVLLSGATVALVLVVAAVVVLAVVVPAAALPVATALLPGLLALGTAFYRRVVGEYGFSVAESPEGLRIRHGLVETRAQTIPAGRVQAVRLHEPLLWRHRDWVRVEVDVAGYAHRGQEVEQSAVLLPVAPREFAGAIVARILGAALPAPTDRPPSAARWRAPLSYRLAAIGRSDRHVVAQSGVLTRTTEVVPLAKVQSLRLRQGPWERALGLASLHVDSAGRRHGTAVLAHRGADEADRLLAELVATLASARSGSDAPGSERTLGDGVGPEA